MAQITISDLHPVENEFVELSDLELESVVGGKGVLDTVKNAAKKAAEAILKKGISVTIPF